MKYPQELAVKLFKKNHLKSIAENSCCALTYMWCLRIDTDNGEALETVSDAIDEGVLEKDCTVKWAEFGHFLIKRKIKVDFKPCNDISTIKERTPVRFDWNGKSHWVGVENGKIEFNSLLNSNCVSKGKPATMRVIHIL